MKWIGQHIYDLISRFRSDVYLENISSGTIVSGGNLGLDSSNKIVKATDSAPDADTSTKGIVELATTAETTTGTDTSRAVTPDGLKDGYQGSTNVTTLGTIGTGVWNGTAIASAYLDSDTAHLSGTQTFTGGKTFEGMLVIDGDKNGIDEAGGLHVDSFTVTDTTTSSSGTLAQYKTVNIEPVTVAATNSSVTVTDAASLKILAAPLAGSNVTITNQWALWVNTGNVRLDGSLKLDNVLLSSVQTSSESFADNDTSLMTSAAINDRINRPSGQMFIKNFNFSVNAGTTEYYFPMASTAESTSSVNQAVTMIMPTAGKLLKIHLRTSVDHSGQTTTFTLYNWDTDENWNNTNKSTLGVQSGTGPDVGEVVTYDFTSSLDSGTNAFTANEMIAVSFQNGGDPGSNTKYVATLVFELDWTSY